MSTLKTTNLQHPSAGVPAIVLDADGDATYAGVHDFSAATVTGVPQGLVLVTPTSIANTGGSASVSGGAVTFTGVTSISLNGVFTSDYENYRIIIPITSTSSVYQLVFLRLRVAGSDITTSTYDYVQHYQNSSNVTGSTGGNSQTAWRIGYTGTAQRVASVLDVLSPATTNRSRYINLATYIDSLPQQEQESGQQTNTSAQDGFSFYAGSGTITGTVRVYGYQD